MVKALDKYFDTLVIGMAPKNTHRVDATISHESVGRIFLSKEDISIGGFDTGIPKVGALLVEVWVEPHHRGRGIAVKMHQYVKKHFSRYKISGDVLSEDGMKFHNMEKPRKVVHNEKGTLGRMAVAFKDFPNPSPERILIPKIGLEDEEYKQAYGELIALDKENSRKYLASSKNGHTHESVNCLMQGREIAGYMVAIAKQRRKSAKGAEKEVERSNG